MTLRQYNDQRTIAAAARNWYLVNGNWEHLTQTEAARRAREVIAKDGTFRRATVDEELDRDGI
mgnify:CR=1 FL=1